MFQGTRGGIQFFWTLKDGYGKSRKSRALNFIFLNFEVVNEGTEKAGN
jgi:hypothetical protein